MKKISEHTRKSIGANKLGDIININVKLAYRDENI